jgi:hypothetical protein
MSIAIVACQQEDPIDDPDVGTITWSGLIDQVITRGDDVDLLEGVTASDSIDGDLTASITVTDDDDFSTHLAGGYTVTYEVENSTGVVSTETKSFTVLVGHNVANGNFELGAYGWTLDQPGGAATVDFTSEGAEFSISNAGTAWWAVQLYQNNVVFKANTTYKLTLEASSVDGRSISVGYEDPNDGFAMLNNGFMPISLSETSEEYVMYYTSTENYGNVKVVVYLGNQLDQDAVGDTPHEVKISKINIEEVTLASDITFGGLDTIDALSGDFSQDLLDGVTVVDGSENSLIDDVTVLGELPDNVMVPSPYYVTYLIELTDGSIAFATRRINFTLARDFDYQAINGDFENGYTGWTQDVVQTDGTGAATFTDNGDGTVSILVTNVSTAAWHIQLQQSDLTFDEGEAYVLRITLKASEERKINVEVVHPGSGFAPIGPTLSNAVVGTDWVTYEIHFTSSADYEGAKIGLLLGNGDGLQPNNVTITVDEFQVYKYDPYNETFDTDFEPWVLDNITGDVNENGEMVVTFEENDLGGDPWNNQLYQASGSELVAGHTYEVEVKVKSSIDRTIRAWIEDKANGYSGIATGSETELILVADTYGILTYRVTITNETATKDAKFVVMFGDSVAQGLAHVVTVDYFKVKDVTNEPDPNELRYEPLNEEFDTTHEPWVLDNITGAVNGSGEMVVTFAESELGSDPWNNQLYQSSGSALIEGRTYEVEVKIKSSIDRVIRIWIEDKAKGYAGIATGSETELTLVADTYDTITYTVTITEENQTLDAKFVVMFGDSAVSGLAQVITIDYFRVTDITDQLTE